MRPLCSFKKNLNQQQPQIFAMQNYKLVIDYSNPHRHYLFMEKSNMSMKVCKFNLILLDAYEQWAVRVLYRVTPALTRDLVS